MRACTQGWLKKRGHGIGALIERQRWFVLDARAHQVQTIERHSDRVAPMFPFDPWQLRYFMSPTEATGVTAHGSCKGMFNLREVTRRGIRLVFL